MELALYFETMPNNPLVRMRVRVLVLAILSFTAVFVLSSLYGCNHKKYRMPSMMEPTFRKGEVVSVDMFAYSRESPRRWDVVVFTHPQVDYQNQEWTARIVGLPGERIDINPEGLFVNAAKISMPFFLSKVKYAPTIQNGPKAMMSFPFVVPTGCYLVLGDNAARAFDSRYWGPLPLENIIGRVETQ